MKILYVLNSGNPGGMEKHVLDLVNGMLKRGNEVFVWCGEGPFEKDLEKTGAIITQRKINFECDIPYILALVTFLKKEKIDVIHAHELKAVANAMLAGFIAKTRIRISHTHTPISTWKINGFKKFIDIFINSTVVNLFSTKEVCLTQLAKSLKIKEGINPNKLVVVPNGVDVSVFDLSIETRERYKAEIRSRYNIPQNAFVFGNVSRLTEEKGHEVLIKAFKEFVEKATDSTNYYLLIAGGGKLEASLKHLISELSIENKVLISGIFDSADLVKYYMSFNAFIFPTWTEGFGYVLCEAMCSRLSIVCSDLPVLKEVGSDTVYYFKVGDFSNLAQKMSGLTTYDSALIEKAFDRIKNNFSQEKFIELYVNLYI